MDLGEPRQPAHPRIADRTCPRAADGRGAGEIALSAGILDLYRLRAETVDVLLAEYRRPGCKRAMLGTRGAVVRRKPTTGAMNLMGEIVRRQGHRPIPDFLGSMHADFAE